MSTGEALRKLTPQILHNIDSSVVANHVEKRRHHLGASEIGAECERYLWLKFRWAKTEHFSGRMLRLFARGHREEATYTQLLRQAGWQVWDTDPATGEQYQCSDCGGHFGGSCDAIAIPPRDIAERLIAVLHLTIDPAMFYVLLEYKTANKAATGRLITKGLRAEKPRHYTQQAIYMDKLQLPVSLYLSVNKDNDDLQGSALMLADSAHAKDMLRRAAIIISSRELPPGLSSDPTFWQCKMCPMRSICHEAAPLERNCRSCAQCRPVADAQWWCDKHQRVITRDTLGEEYACWESIV